MEQLETLARHMNAIAGISNVVRTMKTLSAVNIPSAERAADAISIMRETVLDGLHVALRGLPAPAPGRAAEPARNVLILYGSDHGLCGGFCDRLAEAARDDGGVRDVFAIGARAESALAVQRIVPRATFQSVASVDGLRGLAAELLVAVDATRTEIGANAGLTLLYNQRSPGGQIDVVRQPLLPLSASFIADIQARPWPGEGLPVSLVDENALLRFLVRQYVFVEVFRAGAASLAAEHAARLALMTQAERALDERLEAAQAAYRRARQGQITDELLDLIGGFEALAVDDHAQSAQASEGWGR